MTHRFEVVVWNAERSAMQVIELSAETEQAIEKIVARPGLEVRAITKLYPVMDWRKENFTREEAGVFLCATASKVDKLMAEGDLPRPVKGHPIFSRRVLENYVQKSMAA